MGPSPLGMAGTEVVVNGPADPSTLIRSSFGGFTAAAAIALPLTAPLAMSLALTLFLPSSASAEPPMAVTSAIIATINAGEGSVLLCIPYLLA